MITRARIGPPPPRRGSLEAPLHDLAQRVANVQLLLETLDDPYPTPRSALTSDSGPSPSRYVPCETCRTQGWVRVRGGLKLCLVCDGRGWRHRNASERPWDAYTALPVDEVVDLPTEPVYASQEAVQALLRDREEERTGRYWQLAHSWERRRAFYERHGSYAELRRVLVRLHEREPRRALLVRSIHVEHGHRPLARADALDLALGVLQLALWMRSVKVPRFLVERVASERNEAVLALASAGLTPSEIAARLGIPKDNVKRTLRRRKQNGRVSPAALIVT